MLAGRWYSQQLEREVDVVRWGEYGRPVVVFPTAGGDARGIERFLLVDACRDLIDAGNVKLYSLDSVNGRALLANEGDTGRQAWIQRQFFEFVRHELVPAVRADCASEDIELIAAGASIGAFNAVACACLHPDLFSAAVGMRGTYELRRYFRGPLGDDFTSSSPLEFVPGLGGDQPEAAALPVDHPGQRGGCHREHRGVLAPRQRPGCRRRAQSGGVVGHAVAPRLAPVAGDAARLSPRSDQPRVSG